VWIPVLFAGECGFRPLVNVSVEGLTQKDRKTSCRRVNVFHNKARQSHVAISS
jgi:hypothetical protein